MRKILAILLLFCAVGVTSAQSVHVPAVVNTNDFRGRIEGAFEWEFVDDLSLEAGVQLRLNNDMGSVDRLQTNLGLNYDVCRHLDIGIDYILINIHDYATKSWDSPRHRLNLNVTGKVELGRWELSLRERLQTTFRTDDVNRFEKPQNAMILRSRLMAEYGIHHSRWSPYLLFELHNTLNAPAVVDNYLNAELTTDNYVTRYRAGVGAKFRISRHHRLDFYYYFDYDRNYNIDYKPNRGDLKGYVQENEIRHIFGISYKFKL